MIESNPRFDDLHARYAASLARKLDVLDAAWCGFAASPHDDARRRELETQVHRLAGSALAYGYERLGDCARVADQQMHGWDESAPDTREAPTEFALRLAAPVRLLLDELRRASAEVVAQQASDRETLRVLLVEDDPVQAMLTGAQLEARGCTVRIENSADMLWQILTHWSCHAVVLDYWLRGETATEIAAMLRREPQFAHVALICFSVERDEQVLRAALDAGCDAALGKAEGSERLLALVRTCVARPDRSGKEFA
ncbi:MAG: response regulator [Dokdonella sp.]